MVKRRDSKSRRSEKVRGFDPHPLRFYENRKIVFTVYFYAHGHL